MRAMTKATFIAQRPQPALRAMRRMPQGVIGGARARAGSTRQSKRDTNGVSYGW